MVLFTMILIIIIILKYWNIILQYQINLNSFDFARKIKYNSSLSNMLWKIRWEDIEQTNLDKFVANTDLKVCELFEVFLIWNLKI